MANISNVEVNNTTYGFKDIGARNSIPNIEVDENEECLDISSGKDVDMRQEYIPQIIAFKNANDANPRIRFYLFVKGIPQNYNTIKYGIITFRKGASHPEYPNVPDFPMKIGNQFLNNYDYTEYVLPEGYMTTKARADGVGYWQRPYVTIDGTTLYGKHYYFHYDTTPDSSTNPFIMT